MSRFFSSTVLDVATGKDVQLPKPKPSRFWEAFDDKRIRFAGLFACFAGVVLAVRLIFF